MPERKDQKGETHPRGALGEHPVQAARRASVHHASPGVHSAGPALAKGKRAVRAPLQPNKPPRQGG